MPTTSTHLVCGPTWGPARDAFRHGGLGSSARRVYYEALANGKKTAVECAEELPLAPATVRKALNRLAEHDLARNVDGRWHRVEKTDEEWAGIAAAVDKLGTSERQEQRVLWDRQLRTQTDLVLAKYELAQAARRRAAATARGSLKMAKFWAIEEAYWAAEVAGAVGTVVQLGALRDTFAGRVARELQERAL